MCGIVAMYSPSEPISASSLEKATLRLAHRGPDGQRWWVSDDRRVGLGHARLSIIDLATGNQPIAGEDARLQIVVNGEFYDHDRIRKDLARRGHRLRTRSDSEIALHLYEDHGIDCLNHLRGEFAFVVWDGRENRLFAARDRFGIKPLYYAQAGGVLYLASEAKALFAAGIPALGPHGLLPGHAPRCTNARQLALRGCFAGAPRSLPGLFERPDRARALLGLRLPAGKRTPRDRLRRGLRRIVPRRA